MFDFHTHHITKNGIQNLDSHQLGVKINADKYYSIGSHPWCKEIEINQLEKLIQKTPNIIAIGECGLDKIKSQYPLNKQIEILKLQVQLSEKYKLPLILHIVKAYNEIVKLKKELNPTQKWIIHGFNNYKQADSLIQNGFYLSFGEALLSNNRLQSIFKQINLNRIFLETDDSDAKIENLYTFASDLLNIKKDLLIQQINQNLTTITNGKLA